MYESSVIVSCRLFSIHITITTRLTCTSISVFVFLALMDASFLMELAQQNITSTEQLQLGVFLKMKTSSIRDIMRELDDAVINSFNILEAWLDSRKSVGTSKALFDELSEACLKIKRADLVNFVRCSKCATVTAVY